MRATRMLSSFRSIAAGFPFVALALMAGCGTPAVTADSGVNDSGLGADTSLVVDGGHDAAAILPDAGPPPLCTGTGCGLVDVELLAASSCVLRENGQVDCWGRAQDGELGDGLRGHSDNCRLNAGEANTDCSRTGVTVALPGPAASIVSRGSIQMCAILATSSEVWCWGGQIYSLGSTLGHDRFAPEHLEIGTTPIADGTTGVSTSFANVCWIATDTSVSCLGSGGSGRLGNGSFSDVAMPVTALMPDGTTPITGVLEVDTASGHTCARTATQLFCWGNNHYDQLGVVNTGHQTCGSAPSLYDCSNIAIEVTDVDATTITDIELGDAFSCVLHSTGHVECWGGGQTGGLGNGNLDTTATPVEPTGLSNVDELRVVDGNACALVHDGTVWCWGPANLGEIGDGSMVHAATPCIDDTGAPYDCQLMPSQVMGLTGVDRIALGEGHACALTTSDQVWCWGQSLRYQLGDMMRAVPAFAPDLATALGP